MSPRPPRPGHGRTPGVWKRAKNAGDPDVNVTVFSYQNDDIAKEIIVRAWTDAGFKAALLGTAPGATIADRITAATTALSALPNKPVTLKSAIVLDEDEYHAGWDEDDPDQVVFVLPNSSRAAGNLLETAKMLMASTPNGI